ncbi:MAG: RNA methyltransferase [Alistipes sp.]|nr:RNA methyltransferase [Alistipes sp.]
MTKAEIQQLRALKDKRERDRERLFIAEGEKLVEEILDSHFVVRRVLTTDAKHKGANIELITKQEMERISQLTTPTTMLAVVEQPNNRLSIDKLCHKLVVALDGVQNPGNLGTIVRLADWFGVEEIICSRECADCYNPKVVQATMGAILRVRIHYVDNLSKLLHEARDMGMNIYGTLLDGNNIYHEKLDNKGIIVMGNEGRGVSDECRNMLTHKLLIPPFPADCPTSESLNVAMATGIILSEFRRR